MGFGNHLFPACLDFAPYILCPHFEDRPEFSEDVKMQEPDGIGLDNDSAIDNDGDSDNKSKLRTIS